MIIDENILNCPVSLTKFIYPKVLPCGHTVDLKCLNKFKYKFCPLCSSKFTQSCNDLPTNWIVANLLNLDILLYENDKINQSTIKSKTDIIFYKIFDKELKKLLKDIKNKSKNGQYLLSFFTNIRFIMYSKDIRENISVELITRLKTLGYKVENCQKNSKFLFCLYGLIANEYIIISWK